MNKNYSIDRCLSNMVLNLEVIEELEKALRELQNTISRSHVAHDEMSSTSELEYCTAVC